MAIQVTQRAFTVTDYLQCKSTCIIYPKLDTKAEKWTDVNNRNY